MCLIFVDKKGMIKMSFADLIVRFIFVLVSLMIIQSLLPLVCISSGVGVFLGIISIGLAIYCLSLRIQWNKKIIEKARKNQEKEELKKKKDRKSKLKKLS